MGDNQMGSEGEATGYNDPSKAEQPEHIGLDLRSVRSGDLAPYEERSLPAHLEDSTAISPARAIPPAEITNLLDRYRHIDPIEAMIPVFQEIQTSYGYITQDVADQVSSELGISVTEVYGVLTFYSFFRYTPRGGHVIMTCEGTGCYVRGAGKVRGAVEARLGVGPGETSADGRFTFEPQSICLGACDLGPLVEIEGAYYSYVTPEKMDAIITQWYESGDDRPVGDKMTGGHAPHYEENYGFGPRSDELYAGYDVAQFMPQSSGGTGTTAATATQAPPEVQHRVQDTPPTPQPGGAAGAQSQS
ncbi:MAG: NAD(P)H-dependent oxidoreductase subunit E [Chloroflexi bacterium]|nr:NAD(P)H-dependent oxidoreductase subunit E [Chloroflexota bacterium]